MKINVHELNEKQLNVAVAHALGLSYWLRKDVKFDVNDGYTVLFLDHDGFLKKQRFDGGCSLAGAWFTEYVFDPAHDWEQAGPIIDEHDITVGPWTTSPAMAYIGPEVCWGNPRVVGPTKLVAAMRCFVRSVLGEEIDLPQAVIDIS